MDEWTNFGIPRIPLAAQINTGGGTERLLAAGELPAPIRNLPDARRQLAEPLHSSGRLCWFGGPVAQVSATLSAGGRPAALASAEGRSCEALARGGWRARWAPCNLSLPGQLGWLQTRAL